MTKDLVIFGSFGFGNIGDEAVPLAIGDMLRARGIDCRLHVATRFDKPAMSDITGLGDKYRNQLQQLAAKPVVLSGGGIIEPRANSCLLRYEKYRQITKPLSATLLAGSFEYGVSYGWTVKRQISKMLARLDNIYTRDYLSEVFFRENFPGIPVATIGDVVLGLKSSPTSRISTFGISAKEYIAVSLCQRWKDDPGWHSWIVGELLQISNRYDKPVVFVSLSQQYDVDQDEHHLVADKMRRAGVTNEPFVIEQLLDPRQVADIYKNALLTVSMRLHGCVISYAQKTPFVGLSYHPKVMGFAMTVGWRSFVLPTGMAIGQDSDRYGQAFSAVSFKRNDLLNCCDNALSYGEFNLLPLLTDNIGKLLEQEVNKCL